MQGLDFSQYKPGNAAPFKKAKDEAADGKSKPTAPALKRSSLPAKKGGKSEGLQRPKDAAAGEGGGGGGGGGEGSEGASRSETRLEVHADGGEAEGVQAVQLPDKHSAGGLQVEE